MIKKENNKYFVYNHSGIKRLSEGYETREEAITRLQQIETFKLNDNDVKIITVGLKDNSISFDTAIDDDTGFITVDAVVARTGIQKYLNSELGEAGTGIVGVLRPDYEVTHPESVKSFTNVPVTDNHPNEMVTAENINKYGKGSISIANVVQLDDEKGLSTKLTITDNDLIQSVKDGKKELSVGYSSVLVQKDGVYKGEEYSYIQTNIKANHIAVVDAGRCGGICKMMVDQEIKSNKGDRSMIITINGVEYDVPEEVANEFKKLSGESKDMEEKVEAMDGKLAVKNAEITKLKATTTVSDADVNKMINDKLTLIKMADSIDKVEVKVEDSILDIKKAVCSGYGIDVEGKGETFLDAVIEVKQLELLDKEDRKQKALDSHKKLDDAQTSKTIDVKEIEDKEI